MGVYYRWDRYNYGYKLATNDTSKPRILSSGYGDRILIFSSYTIDQDNRNIIPGGTQEIYLDYTTNITGLYMSEDYFSMASGGGTSELRINSFYSSNSGIRVYREGSSYKLDTMYGSGTLEYNSLPYIKEKLNKIDEVYSPSSSTYPDGGNLGDYWYTLIQLQNLNQFRQKRCFYAL